jgi:hypothetical protein
LERGTQEGLGDGEGRESWTSEGGGHCDGGLRFQPYRWWVVREVG